ncbi:MAG: histidine--tRNA ligase [Metamycoplasmataceae bacterium]
MKKPKGTKDILGKEILIYNHIFKTFSFLALAYNFKQIITPTFEEAALFKKEIGKEAEVIKKELYEFKDKANRLIALKPEGTASVARAYLEEKLYAAKNNQKLFYIDSMFRYESPQKGRLREFFQIGVEIFSTEFFNKIELIQLSLSFLRKIKISDFVLKINFISSPEIRNIYKKQLIKYFKKNIELLSDQQKEKINTNPFRILDEKNINESLIKNAPKISEFYDERSEKEFQEIIKTLDSLEIEYQIDPFLVRGLDYYTDFVFEFVSTSPHLGAKTTIIGGGEYSNLLNDERLSGVGFAVGVERLVEIIKTNINIKENLIDAYFIFETKEMFFDNLVLINDLRKLGITVEFNKKIKSFNKLFQDAVKVNPKYLIFKEKDNYNKDDWTVKGADFKKILPIKNVIKLLKLEKSQYNETN